MDEELRDVLRMVALSAVTASPMGMITCRACFEKGAAGHKDWCFVPTWSSADTTIKQCKESAERYKDELDKSLFTPTFAFHFWRVGLCLAFSPEQEDSILDILGLKTTTNPAIPDEREAASLRRSVRRVARKTMSTFLKESQTVLGEYVLRLEKGDDNG